MIQQHLPDGGKINTRCNRLQFYYTSKIIHCQAFSIKNFKNNCFKFFSSKTAICCKDGKFNPIFYPTLFSLF
jgi:hypothetical protein